METSPSLSAFSKMSVPPPLTTPPPAVAGDLLQAGLLPEGTLPSAEMGRAPRFRELLLNLPCYQIAKIVEVGAIDEVISGIADKNEPLQVFFFASPCPSNRSSFETGLFS